MALAIKAIGYGGPENLTGVEVEVPDPGPGEIKVAVRAAGVNPADIKSYSGLWGTDPGALPKALGFEIAGEVIAAGEGARGPLGPIIPGEEIIAFRISGGYAEEVVIPATAAVPKPPALGWAEAGGLMLTGATAMHALTATGAAAGDTVLIHGGAGGVGLMAVQLAALRGARVIATSSPAKHGLLRELGAEPIAYGPGLSDRVRALAPGGPTVALDLVGTDEALDTSLELVADRDRIATIANFERGPGAGIKLLGGGPGADPGEDVRTAARPELARLAGEGALRVTIARTFPLREARAAHELVGAGHATGKVALLP